MGSLLQDFALSSRRLSRTPMTTGTVLLVLAAVIGIHGLLFAALDAIFFQPLPFSNPERLVVIWENNLERGMERSSVSAANFFDWHRQTKTFARIAAVRSMTASLGGNDGLMQVRGARVSSGFFELLGIQPQGGRFFSEEDSTASAGATVILSHALWQGQYGSDPGMVGRVLRLDGKLFTVIGISPPEFEFPYGSSFWLPIDLKRESADRGVRSLLVIGRLQPGLSLDQAQSEMNIISQRLEREYPEVNEGTGAYLVALREELTRSSRTMALFLFGTSALVLMVTCVNLSSLQLVCVAQRRRELAIRAVLGAQRLDFIRPIMLESILLGLVGGASGLLVTFWGRDLLQTIPGINFARSGSLSDARILGFVLLASLISGALIGLVPAIQFSTDRTMQVLKEQSTGSGSIRFSKFQKVLVVLQVCLSLPLLIGCIGLVKSFTEVQRIDPGFDPEGLLTVVLSIPDNGNGGGHEEVQTLEGILQRVDPLPTVEGVAAISDLPLSGSNMNGTFVIEGRPDVPGTLSPAADQRVVTPKYFETMRIPILAGRAFVISDDERSSPVAVVNVTMARLFWPGEDPVGKHIRIGSPQEVSVYGESVARRIVGVVGDVKHLSLGAEHRPELYVPYPQSPMNSMALVVRTAHGQRALTALSVNVRDVIDSQNRQVMVGRILPMNEILSESAGPPGFQSFFLVLFTLVSMLLAALSIYTLVSFSITQGARGIGISIAVGAQRRDVLWLVAGEAIKLSIRGAALGILVTAALFQIFSHLTAALSTSSPALYAAAALSIITLVTVAGLVPAQKALGIQPSNLLRRDG